MTMMREVGKRRKSREGRFGSGSALELVPGERSEPGIIPGTWTTVGASTFLADSDDDGVASYLVQGTLVPGIIPVNGYASGQCEPCLLSSQSNQIHHHFSTLVGNNASRKTMRHRMYLVQVLR